MNTTTATAPATQRIPRIALPATALLAAAAGIAAGGGWVEPELMRFMAFVKALIAMGALAAIAWRIARPTPAATSIAYGLAIAAMAAGTGLIWSLHAAAGAYAVHGGLAALLLVAAIDRRGWAHALGTATARSRTA